MRDASAGRTVPVMHHPCQCIRTALLPLKASALFRALLQLPVKKYVHMPSMHEKGTFTIWQKDSRKAPI